LGPTAARESSAVRWKTDRRFASLHLKKFFHLKKFIFPILKSKNPLAWKRFGERNQDDLQESS